MEAEQYFTTLYKTQVNELTDEVDDSKERDRENQNDKEALVLQIKSLVARADNDARYVTHLSKIQEYTQCNIHSQFCS